MNTRNLKTKSLIGASVLNAGLGLVDELHKMSVWCRNETADDIADLLNAAANEIERLRAALVECEHQTHSMRVWGGQSWTYHPPQAGKIARCARAALDVPNHAANFWAGG